jgi:hypothetical protein
MLRKLKDMSQPKTCKLRHILVQPSADIQFFDKSSCLHEWKQTLHHQNVPSPTLYFYEFNSGTRGLCPGPQNFSLKGEKNLKTDTTITIFSPIICTPEKGLFLIFYITKNTKYLCLVWKYTHQVCAHIRWCLEMWRSFSVICIITALHVQGSDILSLWDIWFLSKYTTMFLYKNIPHHTSQTCFERMDSTHFLQCKGL